MGQMIFHTCNYGVMIISRDVPIYRYSRDFSRLFVVILQYIFNSSRNRYWSVEQ
ncbi:hypothetical protein EVA_07909 [gut metagenome]|uniref:Uncharacterized protein n=1 Tax=gut metagenome TaxID=749906 RepID=J9GAW3_9ZZZZ